MKTKTHNHCNSSCLHSYIEKERKFASIFLFFLLFGTALLSNYYEIGLTYGYSWGQPYHLANLYIEKYTKEPNDFNIGDYVVYRSTGGLVAHEITRKYPTHLLIKAYIFNSTYVYEEVEYDQIRGKFVFNHPLKETNDFFEICIPEVKNRNMTTTDAVFSCLENMAVAADLEAENLTIIYSKNNDGIKLLRNAQDTGGLYYETS